MTLGRFRDRLATLPQDESGATAIFTGFLMVVALGFVGLGVDVGVGYNARRVAQNAADSAAFSAGVGKMAGATNTSDQARAVAVKYGLANGVDSVQVAVNNPPTSGALAGNTQAVEVIVTRPGRRFFSSFFNSGATTIRARAVATAGRNGNGCVVAFDPSAPLTILDNGNSNVNLVGCSMYDNSTSTQGLFLNGSATLSADAIYLAGNYGQNGNSSVTTVNGIKVNQAPLADPYASAPEPAYSGCTYNSLSVTNTRTFSNIGGAPTVFCNGLTINAGANVTFDPGVYVIDRGTFVVNGNATVSGQQVTFFLSSSTGSGHATLLFNGTGVTNLTAPGSGPLAGLLFFQDRNAASTGTNTFNGTSTTTFQGALYFKNQTARFNGTNSTTGGCTQLLADKVVFNGTNTFAVNCTGTGVRSIGGQATQLVE